LKADIIVHGTSGTARIIPAANSSYALTESFTLERGEDNSTLPGRELWTKEMATISWVEITEVEFVNGIVWHEPKPATCTATPSGFLLISGK